MSRASCILPLSLIEAWVRQTQTPTARGDSVMPARHPNWGSFLAEAAPLKSILQVKIGNGITIVAQFLGTFVALVWSHSGSGMNLSPHQDLSRRRALRERAKISRTRRTSGVPARN
uniref:(northern house mosquito) hypothetical protein n=1 Tax=Culex pipiens TaxID=7175 RepID=A0A8D8F149_CULPI